MFSRDQVLALMRERVHHPAGMRELLQVLKVPKDDRTSFKRHIKSLVASGDLIQIRGERFGLPEKMDLYVGRLQTHPAGYGFVTPERPLESGALSRAEALLPCRNRTSSTQTNPFRRQFSTTSPSSRRLRRQARRWSSSRT